MLGEKLMIVLHPEASASGGRQPSEFPRAILDDLRARNRKLPDFKRVSRYVIWHEDFPRTASLKIKRPELAERLSKLDREQVLKALD
jgi:acyl-CoA synthetase (AMP-forming)/AMP-acid ligase II